MTKLIYLTSEIFGHYVSEQSLCRSGESFVVFQIQTIIKADVVHLASYCLLFNKVYIRKR